MKGLSTGAFFGTKQHGHGGERDASSESPIGCDFEGGEGKKNPAFSALARRWQIHEGNRGVKANPQLEYQTLF